MSTLENKYNLTVDQLDVLASICHAALFYCNPTHKETLASTIDGLLERIYEVDTDERDKQS